MEYASSLVVICALLGIPNTTGVSLASSDDGKMADPGDSSGFKLGVSSPKEAGQEEYRTSYYFAGQQHQPNYGNGDWNRDAYSPPAVTDVGYSGDASHSHGYQSSYHPAHSAPSTSYGVDDGQLFSHSEILQNLC